MVFALAGDSTMTSRRPPRAVSLVGDTFALLSRSSGGARRGSSRRRAQETECDRTLAPLVKRTAPAGTPVAALRGPSDASRTVTRTPVFPCGGTGGRATKGRKEPVRPVFGRDGMVEEPRAATAHFSVTQNTCASRTIPAA